MITLAALRDLAQRDDAHLEEPVAPLRIGARTFDTDTEPVVMAAVNLSRDSTYRESVATSTESALRKARTAIAQGAHCVDLGAESSTAAAARVPAAEQIARLVPVITPLAADGIAVSVEGYHPDVVEAGLRAGARIVNLTGTVDEQAVFDLTAAQDATLVLCDVTTAHVRDIAEAERDDPIPGMVARLGERVVRARAAGVSELVVDPGLGFYYGNLTDPAVRVDYQTRVLAGSHRLRSLGLPVCHALPHAFDLFEEEFRTAEGFFAVVARLGGTGVFRTHEVARVVPVLRAMATLSVGD